MGTQRNPKYDDVKLLEDRRRIMDQDDDNDGREGGGDKCYPNVELDVSDTGDDNNDDLFMARLIAVISDYNENGFPVALIAHRWNQIWPGQLFPSEYVIERTVRCGGSGINATTVIRKKVRLLRWLRWKRERSKCRLVCFRTVDGVVLAFNRCK